MRHQSSGVGWGGGEVGAGRRGRNSPFPIRRGGGVAGSSATGAPFGFAAGPARFLVGLGDGMVRGWGKKSGNYPRSEDRLKAHSMAGGGGRHVSK
jgi:hypothetical protein